MLALTLWRSQENIQQLLIGSDVPGSVVTLEVAKGGDKVRTASLFSCPILPPTAIWLATDLRHCSHTT